MTETRDSKRLDGLAEAPGGRPPAATGTPDRTSPADAAETADVSPAFAGTETLELPRPDLLVRPATPADLVVRPATPADLPAIVAMLRAAFGYDLEARLVERLEHERRVTISVVAVSDGCVVGHALLSRVELTAPGEPSRPALALAPVAVAPEHQGRGIGSLVVRTCVRLADPHLAVFVIGDPGFYARFGFEPAAPHRVKQRFEVPPEHFMVRLAGPASADEVERTLDYPAAFDGS